MSTTTDDDQLSTRVIAAIADVRGVEPAELDFRLQDEVDADAIDALDAHEGGPWTFEVDVDGHRVAIDDDGTVTVDGRTYGE